MAAVEGNAVTPVDPAVLNQWPVAVVASAFAGVAWFFIRALMETLKLERELNKELRTENRALNQSILDKYIPTLTQFVAEAALLTKASAEAARVMQEQSRRGHDR